MHRSEAGAEAWRAAGSPRVPSLLVDGRTVPILHVSQIASALGVPFEAELVSSRLGWDVVTILSSWCDDLVPLCDRELLGVPTPSRGRSVRNLAVNSFYPIEWLPDAWRTGTFDWDSDNEAAREASLTDPADLGAYLAGVLASWQGFLLDHGDAADRRDPVVASVKGPLRFSALVDMNRWHSAYHHRQVRTFLQDLGMDVRRAPRMEDMTDLRLPGDVY